MCQSTLNLMKLFSVRCTAQHFCLNVLVNVWSTVQPFSARRAYTTSETILYHLPTMPRDAQRVGRNTCTVRFTAMPTDCGLNNAPTKRTIFGYHVTWPRDVTNGGRSPWSLRTPQDRIQRLATMTVLPVSLTHLCRQCHQRQSSAMSKIVRKITINSV